MPLPFLALAVGTAWAHPARASAVFLDVGPTEIRASVEFPRDQLAMAIGGTPNGDAPLPDDVSLTTYTTEHMAISTGSTPLAEQVRGVSWQDRDGQPSLVVDLAYTVPEGADLGLLTLQSDAIVHTVVSHKTYVYLRRDVAMGQIGEARVLGTIKRGRTALDVPRADASAWKGLRAAVAMGVGHIAEGTDHLLFLACLLLVAPLRAEAGRWSPAGSLPRALRRVLAMVTAFTLGHSLTLAAAALGVLRLPSAPIEVAIAGSVAIAAVHALRPVLPRRDVWIAGGFGLLHGLAFASALSGMGFDPYGLVLALLGFNLGVEAGQLVAVAAVLPTLLLASHTRGGVALRWAGALTALVGALAWIGERAFGLPNPIDPVLSAALAHPAPLAAGLLAATALSWWFDSYSPHPSEA